MYLRIALVTLATLALTSCATGPNTQQSGHVQAEIDGIVPGNELGVTVDDTLRVVDLDPQGAANLAGVQGGDILIDLTLLEMGENTYVPSDSVVVESPLPTPTATIEAAPLPPEATFDNDTVVSSTLPLADRAESDIGEDAATPPAFGDAVPFTDREQVKYLIGLGATMKLRVNRGGSVLEIILRPTPRAPRPDLPTPTPVLAPDDYF
mgnify:CR=1 FL=1